MAGGTAVSGTLEIELKLEIAAGDLDAALADLATIAPVAVVRRQLVSTYHDTPDAALRRAGFSLRVREADGRYVQTVKAGGAAAGLFARPEWEIDLPDARPRLDPGAGPLAGVIDAAALDLVAPAFVVQVDRAAFVLPFADATVEVALDRGSVAADGADADFCEIELELRSGPPAALFALARRVDAVAPVRIGVVAKSERGWRAAEHPAGRAHKAEPVPLDPEMDAVAGFQAIAHACIRQFRLNETVLRGADDPDALHQARVGLRRLRSALAIFAPLYANDPDAPHLREGLRALAAVLGRARDLDVLAARIEGDAGREALNAARDAAYRAVADALDAPQTRHLMLDLVRWLTTGAWRDDPATARPRARSIEATAARILDRSRKRLKRRGAHLPRLDDEARHRVRIAAKRLRYAAEFFGALYAEGKPAKRRRRFLKAIEALQDDLGALNDRAAGDDHVARFGVTLRRDETPADTLLARADDALDTLLDVKRFWR